jgi:phage gpG-like protein
MAEMVRIEVDDAAVRRLFAAVQSRAKNLAPFYKATGTVVSQSIRHNFDVGGRYSAVGSWRGGSTRWKPLSADAFLARFGKKDFKKTGALSESGRGKAGNRRILQRDGHLLQSITFNVTFDGVEVGTNKIYASTQNFGAKNRVIKAKNKKTLSFFFGGAQRFPKQVTVTIPARPFMVVQDEDVEQIKALGAKHIAEGL